MLDKTSRDLARVQTVQAAGLLTTETTSYEVAFWFGKIIADPIVDASAQALGFAEGTCELAVTFDDYVKIIKEMTPQERVALRERIAGK